MSLKKSVQNGVNFIIQLGEMGPNCGAAACFCIFIYQLIFIMADEEFENTDAGASQTEKVESQRLKNGSLVMMKGNPCKVTEVSTAKPGKHGSAKVICKGKDILTGK